jgi:hypothetical protein
MTFSRWIIVLWMGWTLVPRLAALEAKDAAVYRQGRRDFRAGRYTAARNAFENIAPRYPDDQSIQHWLSQSRVKAEVEARRGKTREEAATQARLLLAVRRSVFQELGGSAPAVAVTSAGTATRFSFPEEFLFPKTGLDLTAPGDAALSLVKDFIQTHRTVYVGVVCEQDTKADEDSQRRNIRRTIALGARLFRQTGLAPTQIRLTARPGEKGLFHVISNTLPPTPDPVERELEGVLITGRQTTVDLDRDVAAEMEISLLDPSGVRAWAVKMVRLANGEAVRTFGGTSDVWTSLSWDGRDNQNRPVPPGAYRAFLTARAFSGSERTDSMGLKVDKRRSPAPSRSSAPDPLALDHRSRDREPTVGPRGRVSL